MTNVAIVDNDILIKCACYRMLAELLAHFGGTRSIGVLGAARFVVANRLGNSPFIKDRSGASTHWQEFLAGVDELEPTTEEVELATSIEEAATSAGVVLDGGESQLCAMTIERTISYFLTGDKRAIEALEVISGGLPSLGNLAGRVVCLEQVMLALTNSIGEATTKTRVCAEPEADKAMAICFCCWSREATDNFDQSGLLSYIGDLRTRAPVMLCGGLTFT